MVSRVRNFVLWFLGIVPLLCFQGVYIAIVKQLGYWSFLILPPFHILLGFLVMLAYKPGHKSGLFEKLQRYLQEKNGNGSRARRLIRRIGETSKNIAIFVSAIAFGPIITALLIKKFNYPSPECYIILAASTLFAAAIWIGVYLSLLPFLPFKTNFGL